MSTDFRMKRQIQEESYSFGRKRQAFKCKKRNAVEKLWLEIQCAGPRMEAKKRKPSNGKSFQNLSFL